MDYIERHIHRTSVAYPDNIESQQPTNQLYQNGIGTMFVVKNSETLIWKNLKEGDKSALGELYDLYIEVLFSYGMHHSQDRAYVMDCIHDLFVDLYKYRRNLALTDNVKGYLFKSLKRKINRQYNNKIVAVSMDPYQSIPKTPKRYTKSHEEVIILSELTSERTARLVDGLNRLTKKQKKVLFLRFNQEKSYKEIAEVMDVSVETSRTTIYRAIKTLRKQQFNFDLSP